MKTSNCQRGRVQRGANAATRGTTTLLYATAAFAALLMHSCAADLVQHNGLTLDACSMERDFGTVRHIAAGDLSCAPDQIDLQVTRTQTPHAPHRALEIVAAGCGKAATYVAFGDRWKLNSPVTISEEYWVFCR